MHVLFEFSWYFTEGDCYDLQYASYDCNGNNTNIGKPICGTDLLGNAVTYTDECNIAFIKWQNSCLEDSEILLRFIYDGPCDGNELTEGKQNQYLFIFGVFSRWAQIVICYHNGILPLTNKILDYSHIWI